MLFFRPLTTGDVRWQDGGQIKEEEEYLLKLKSGYFNLKMQYVKIYIDKTCLFYRFGVDLLRKFVQPASK
jgi:hypothetical protein